MLFPYGLFYVMEGYKYLRTCIISNFDAAWLWIEGHGDRKTKHAMISFITATKIKESISTLYA
jgi:hypothetical protein